MNFPTWTYTKIHCRFFIPICSANASKLLFACREAHFALTRALRESRLIFVVD